jgi:hypothetical protein
MSPRLQPVLVAECKWLSLVTWWVGKCVGVRSSVIGNPREELKPKFLYGAVVDGAGQASEA